MSHYKSCKNNNAIRFILKRRLRRGKLALVIALFGITLSGWSLGLLAANERRVALVIGNANYPMMPLSNPRNDAIAMEKTLRSVGFDVIRVLDADLKTMQNAVLEFTKKLQPNSTALFFYAGHGMQTNGRNYLMPIDAKVESENAIRYEGLNMADVLEELEASNARVKLVVLDACRNNPFERKMRGASRGLVAIDAARGTLIAYATSPGSTAADGNGNNGLYTEALLDAIKQPGLKVEEVFKNVRIQVSKASNGAQLPWESSSLTGDFVFTPATAASPKTQPAPVMLATAAPQRGADHLPAANPATTSEDAHSSCDDLSGSWENSAVKPVLCTPKEITLKRAGPENTYELLGHGCAVPIKGMATLDGATLTFEWNMPPCSGKTVYTMDANCSSGSGPITINPSFLCKDNENTGVIRRQTKQQ